MGREFPSFFATKEFPPTTNLPLEVELFWTRKLGGAFYSPTSSDSLAFLYENLEIFWLKTEFTFFILEDPLWLLSDEPFFDELGREPKLSFSKELNLWSIPLLLELFNFEFC